MRQSKQRKKTLITVIEPTKLLENLSFIFRQLRRWVKSNTNAASTVKHVFADDLYRVLL